MIAIADVFSTSSSGGSHDHYGSYNRIFQNFQAKRWTKNDKDYNSKRNAHIMIKEVTQMMNVMSYMVFHQIIKKERILC